MPAKKQPFVLEIPVTLTTLNEELIANLAEQYYGKMLDFIPNAKGTNNKEECHYIEFVDKSDDPDLKLSSTALAQAFTAALKSYQIIK